MWIDQLHLKAFGPFTDCTLSLTPGLNVLYGPNEAGKSSTLRAIDALLFGVPSRTADDFLHDYRQMRIGGVLVRQDGERLSCVRRKGNKATLRDADDEESLDEGAISRFLGAIDQDFFRSVFGIDHQRLREGGIEVVRGEGRIGELLFAAGGVAHLRAIQQQLEDDAGELFKPRAKQPRINEATARLEQLRAEIRDFQVPSEEWTRYQAARTEHRQRAARLRQELEYAEAARERLRRIQAAWPTLCAWKSCQESLHEVADAQLVSEDAEERRSEAYRQLSLAESTLKQAQENIQQLTEQIEAIDLPTALLSEQQRIDELYKRLGSHEKGAEDRTTLEARRRTARNHAKKTLEKLGWTTSVDEVHTRRLTEAHKTVIRRLAKRHGELVQRRRGAEQNRVRIRKRIEQLQQQLAETPPLGEPTQLSATLHAAAAATPVADGLDARQRAVELLQREAEDALARLPWFAGTLDEAVRLKVPSTAAVEHFAEQARELEASHDRLRQRRQEYEAQQEQLGVQLATLEKGDVVPTEQELQRIRSLRDAGVRLAVDMLRGEAVDEQGLAELLREIEGASDLPTALDLTVRQADLMADRLRREADRVAEKTQLLTQQQSLARRADRLEQQFETARGAQQQHLANWTDRWNAAKLKPGSPREMRAWLEQHARLVDSARQLATLSTTLQADQSRIDELRNQLVRQLSECGLASSDEPGSRLSLLVEQAQTYVDRLQRDRASHDQLQKELQRAQQEAEAATDEQQMADDDLSRWTKDWAEAMTPLGLASDAQPDEAEATLAAVEQLFQQIDEADSFRDRVWGIDKTTEEFTEAARDMAAVAASDLVDQPVDELVSRLKNRVDEARHLEQQQKMLTRQRAEQERAVENAAAAAREAQAVLDSLLVEAGCETIEELSAAIERSHQKRQRQQRLDELGQQLQPYRAGQSLSQLYADAAAVDPDRLAGDVAAADATVEQLRADFEVAMKAEQQANIEFERYDGSAAAAEKAAERHYLIAKLEEDARDYIVARVAGSLLQRAIERYQQRSQGPVLALASDRFEQLTCGAFSGLRPDYDGSGNDVLVGIRQEQGTLVQVDEMSEGTRDQLYLALRLATLEHWLEDHEPAPLIVDDILLSFDDARAEAALATLLELSHRTQVLFFTHHDHLVSVAQKVSDAYAGDVAIRTINESPVPALQ